MKLIRYVLLLICLTTSMFAQGGMRFQEFAKRLEPYFDSELISDLEKKLPQGSNYSIWGWDAGDFSGDGFYDVAFTVKLTAENRRLVQVYLFVDVDGYLTEVSQIPYEYVELPLEIGVIIKQNACFITKKHKQFNWEIKGFRFDNGNLSLFDEFNTEKLDKYTHETYTNYQSLTNSEKYISNNKNDLKFQTNYSAIPSYARGRQIYRGISSELKVESTDFVTKGAYFWKGPEDASFSVKSVYDDEYLYLSFKIHDDTFIPQNCEDCIADYLEIWFDVSPLKTGSRFIKKSGERLQFRNSDAGADLYSIKIYPGDFLEKKAFVKEVSSSEDLQNYQKASVKKIKAIGSLRDDGYSLKCRIPFALFGYDNSPGVDKTYEIGCSIVYHDIDNEYRPEEETNICTSVFDPKNPSSFGSLYIIPNNKWFGETENIYTEDIIKSLIDAGF